MQIRTKFIFEILVLSAILAVASIMILYYASEVEENISSLNDDLIPRSSILKDMRLAASNILTSSIEYVVFEENFVSSHRTVSDIDVKDNEIISEIQIDKTQFSQLLELYTQKTSETISADSINTIEQQWEEFDIISDKFVDYGKRGITGDEFIKIKNELKDSKNALVKEIDLVLIENEKEVKNKEQIVSELIRNTTLIISSIVLIFVIVFIILRYYFLRSILIPLSKIRHATKEIAKNNLDTKIDDISNDEIGDLSADVNKMTSELKEIRNKLLKSEKLSTVGLLSGRLAHDIRNPLAIIKLNIEYLKIKYVNNEEKRFDRIVDAIMRIDHQVSEVLDFIKTSSLKIEKVSLLTILKNVISTKKISDNIEVILPQNDVVIECDSHKIGVVFSNLFLNAVDAVKDDGKVKIRFTSIPDAIKIEFEDSGDGIDPEDLDQIFEPLFTTKQKGTGLGLSSVESIIHQHHGKISVSSPPTIFTITLPKTLD
ncbi:ATP-binding protein [Nitrosopumilus sp.]|uniref:sensor histidine kinase n=1 Tax=Nitrosopumilus sp. TaxID=2024843 RepID=UPI003D10C739